MMSDARIPYDVTPERVAAARAGKGWFCHHAVQANGIPVTVSIGLSDCGLASELVMLGVEERLARMILAGLATRLADGRKMPESGTRLSGILEGHVIQFQELDRHDLERLNGTISSATGARVRSALLVQVPDRFGNLPGDAGCDRVFETCQSPQKIGGTP